MTLTQGFPATREALYAYDALVVANLEGDFFTRAQLTQAAEFVSERGGGLLVLGGRSFAQGGLVGTPLEAALPVELTARSGGLSRALLEQTPRAGNVITLTAAGETHPVMRIGPPSDVRQLWEALPPLPASAPLGGTKPGATLLAATAAPGGAVHPVVAVQRYGRGRSMVFAGEASWRWRMMQGAADRTYEIFWRQALRWLAGPSPEPVTIDVPDAAEAGDGVAATIDTRDAAFAPVGDAVVTATLTLPGGDARPLTVRRDAAAGRYVAPFQPEVAGLYRLRADARRGTQVLGTADRWFYVGGSDREMADPRLNEAFLRRLARASGGQYVRAHDAASVVPQLASLAPQGAEPERRELWNQPWAFALVIALMSAEWILRRRWGLR